MAQAGARCSARSQLIAVPGVTHAAAASSARLRYMMPLLLSCLSGTGLCTMLGSSAADRPRRRDARRHGCISSASIHAAALALVLGQHRLALVACAAARPPPSRPVARSPPLSPHKRLEHCHLRLGQRLNNRHHQFSVSGATTAVVVSTSGSAAAVAIYLSQRLVSGSTAASVSTSSSTAAVAILWPS